jgi:predicted MFS family arabinose efflux permease
MPARLWHDSDFRRLWIGQTASQLGEHTSLVIIPLIAVLTLHAGAGQVGVLRAAGQAPILLLSLLAGAWVDRWRTRTVLVLADLGRAVALAAVLLVPGLGLGALLVVAFALGALSVFFDVAYQTSLVRLLPRDRLLSGNSAVEGSRSAAQMAGPALGGTLVSVMSASFAAASSALLFVLSCSVLVRIRFREPVPGRTRRPIRAGIRFVLGDPALRTVCLASAAFQFAFAATMTAYLVFLPRDLHLSGTAVGLALAATGPGALVGSLLAARLPARFGYGVVLVSAATLGDGVFLFVPALHGPPAFPALVAIAFVFGSAGQLVNVTMMAIRQSVTPDGLQGRVAATINFAGMGMLPLGSLLGGVLAHQWGLRTSLLVTAVAMLISPVVIGLSPLARLGRDLPAPPGGHGAPESHGPQ